MLLKSLSVLVFASLSSQCLFSISTSPSLRNQKPFLQKVSKLRRLVGKNQAKNISLFKTLCVRKFKVTPISKQRGEGLSHLTITTLSQNFYLKISSLKIEAGMTAQTYLDHLFKMIKETKKIPLEKWDFHYNMIGLSLSFSYTLLDEEKSTKENYTEELHYMSTNEELSSFLKKVIKNPSGSFTLNLFYFEKPESDISENILTKIPATKEKLPNEASSNETLSPNRLNSNQENTRSLEDLKNNDFANETPSPNSLRSNQENTRPFKDLKDNDLQNETTSPNSLSANKENTSNLKDLKDKDFANETPSPNSLSSNKENTRPFKDLKDKDFANETPSPNSLRSNQENTRPFKDLKDNDLQNETTSPNSLSANKENTSNLKDLKDKDFANETPSPNSLSSNKENTRPFKDLKNNDFANETPSPNSLRSNQENTRPFKDLKDNDLQNKTTSPNSLSSNKENTRPFKDLKDKDFANETSSPNSLSSNQENTKEEDTLTEISIESSIESSSKSSSKLSNEASYSDVSVSDEDILETFCNHFIETILIKQNIQPFVNYHFKQMNKSIFKKFLSYFRKFKDTDRNYCLKTLERSQDPHLAYKISRDLLKNTQKTFFDQLNSKNFFNSIPPSLLFYVFHYCSNLSDDLLNENQNSSLWGSFFFKNIIEDYSPSKIKQKEIAEKILKSLFHKIKQSFQTLQNEDDFDQKDFEKTVWKIFKPKLSFGEKLKKLFFKNPLEEAALNLYRDRLFSSIMQTFPHPSYSYSHFEKFYKKRTSVLSPNSKVLDNSKKEKLFSKNFFSALEALKKAFPNEVFSHKISFHFVDKALTDPFFIKTFPKNHLWIKIDRRLLSLEDNFFSKALSTFFLDEYRRNCFKNSIENSNYPLFQKTLDAIFGLDFCSKVLEQSS